MNVSAPAAPQQSAAPTAPPDTEQIKADILRDNKNSRKKALGEASNRLFSEVKQMTGNASTLLGSNGNIS